MQESKPRGFTRGGGCEPREACNPKVQGVDGRDCQVEASRIAVSSFRIKLNRLGIGSDLTSASVPTTLCNNIIVQPPRHSPHPISGSTRTTAR